MQFFILRFSPCPQCQPHYCDQKEYSAENHKMQCFFHLWNIILIIDAILVKLILDRIVCVHCNCKNIFPLCSSGIITIRTNIKPLIRIRYIHIRLKIFQFRIDHHVFHRFFRRRSYYILYAIFYIRIICIFCFICSNFLCRFICVQIGKIGISLFQIIPTAFIILPVFIDCL